MAVMHRTDELPEELPRLVLTLPPCLEQVVEELPAHHQLQHEVETGGGLELAQEAHHVWVRDALHDVALPQHFPQQLGLLLEEP